MKLHRRREKQVVFNAEHNITPRTVTKVRSRCLRRHRYWILEGYDPNNPHALAPDQAPVLLAAEEQAEYSTIPQLEKGIAKIKKRNGKSGP